MACSTSFSQWIDVLRRFCFVVSWFSYFLMLPSSVSLADSLCLGCLVASFADSLRLGCFAASWLLAGFPQVLCVDVPEIASIASLSASGGHIHQHLCHLVCIRQV